MVDAGFLLASLAFNDSIKESPYPIFINLPTPNSFEKLDIPQPKLTILFGGHGLEVKTRH